MAAAAPPSLKAVPDGAGCLRNAFADLRNHPGRYTTTPPTMIDDAAAPETVPFHRPHTSDVAIAMDGSPEEMEGTDRCVVFRPESPAIAGAPDGNNPISRARHTEISPGKTAWTGSQWVTKWLIMVDFFSHDARR